MRNNDKVAFKSLTTITNNSCNSKHRLWTAAFKNKFGFVYTTRYEFIVF